MARLHYIAGYGTLFSDQGKEPFEDFDTAKRWIISEVLTMANDFDEDVAEKLFALAEEMNLESKAFETEPSAVGYRFWVRKLSFYEARQLEWEQKHYPMTAEKAVELGHINVRDGRATPKQAALRLAQHCLAKWEGFLPENLPEGAYLYGRKLVIGIEASTGVTSCALCKAGFLNYANNCESCPLQLATGIACIQQHSPYMMGGREITQALQRTVHWIEQQPDDYDPWRDREARTRERVRRPHEDA